MRRIDRNHPFSYSLVSNYERWMDADKLYDKYWGRSETPPDPDKFELEQKLSFYAQLFKLAYLPQCDPDDTALILGHEFEYRINHLMQLTPEFRFKSNKGVEYNVIINRPDFETLCDNRFKAIPRQQVEIKGILPNGLNFIGYADEVYENCIIDIKTTSNFDKSNYDKSLQIPLYLHFIQDYLVQRGFYQVTEFYRPTEKGVKKNEFVMKDTFMIESEKITDAQLTRFADLCKEILDNVPAFEKDLDNCLKYFTISSIDPF